MKKLYFSGKWQIKSWQIWGLICIFSFILTTIYMGTSLTKSNAAGGISHDISSPGDWPTYMGDPGHSGYNANETIINPTTAPNLKLHWQGPRDNHVSSQPIVVNGVVYWGSWDGNEHAMTVNGSKLWITNLGQTQGLCYPKQVGVIGSPTVTTAQINGTATSVLLVGGANTTFYALDATNGSIIWQRQLSASTDTYDWDSSVVYNGSVYIGISSHGDCPLVPGQLFQLDITTGDIQDIFNVVPQGCLGGGIWGTPTIDTATGKIYIVTGNGNFSKSPCPVPEPYTYAIVELQTLDLSVVDSWQIPKAQRANDSDFGNTPTLFQANIGGATQNLVGVANKNGLYYAFTRENLSSGPVWTAPIAIGGSCAQCGGGSISASAWDGTNLYVGGGKTTINNVSCTGSIQALDSATGNLIWQDCLTQGHVIAAVTVIPGIVIVTQGNTVSLIATATGQILNSLVDTTTTSYYFASATVSNGMLFAANMNGKFFAYGL